MVPETTPPPRHTEVVPVKRKRGRPPKKVDPTAQVVLQKTPVAPVPSKPRGRPNTDGGAVAEELAARRTSVFIAEGPKHIEDALDPSSVLPGAKRVALTAADGVVASAVPPGGEQLVGRQVEGVVDGEFAGGYFLTVRVNGCLLRGLVWDEDVAEEANQIT
jgi:hypothetical protein